MGESTDALRELSLDEHIRITALEFAVRNTQGTATDGTVVLDDAKVFEAYIRNGE